MNTHLRLSMLLITGIATCLSVAATYAQTTAATKPEEIRSVSPPPSAAAKTSAALTADDIRYAQLMMGSMDEQLQIAHAKMSNESIERKRDIGRRSSLSDAADEQQRLLAAQAQQMDEQHQRLCDQLKSLSEVDKARGNDAKEYELLIAASAEKLSQIKDRLKRVTSQKATLDEQVGGLRRTHVRELLKAAITQPVSQIQAPEGGAIEDLLNEEVKLPGTSSAMP